ncbi:dockerin type I domain-containing protein [Rubripirellula reticaptiva]|nr:dockerin type I domain-containing protein [Rubripirellula reticaptiva]
MLNRQERARISKLRTPGRRRRTLRQFETLEKRRLLAADFVVNRPDLALELWRDNDEIVVATDVVAGQIPQEIQRTPIYEIEELIDIRAGSLLVDSDIDLGSKRLEVLAASIVIDGARLMSDSLIAFSAADRPDLVDYLFSEGSSPATVANSDASIVMRGSMISGSEVLITADGSTNSRWDELAGYQDVIAGELLNQLQSIPQVGISSISPLSGQAKVHAATAHILVDNTLIVSSGDVTIDAQAVADASFNALAINANDASVLVSVGFSHSDSSATIELMSGSMVHAGGAVNIFTDATSTAEVTSRTEANSRATPSNRVKTAFNMALALTDETSVITVDSSVEIVAADVTIDAHAEVVNQVKSTAAVFDDGTLGFSAVVGVDNARVTAEVAGAITSNSESGDHILSLDAAIVNASTDELTLTSPIERPLKVGEQLTYTADAASSFGLIDGVTYLVHGVSDPIDNLDGTVDQRVRLIQASSLSIDARQVPADSVHSLSRPMVASVATTSIASELGSGDGLITMSLPSGIARVIYLGPESPDVEADEEEPMLEGITGLTQNQEYEVVAVGDQYKLRLPGDSAFIDFITPSHTENHGFYYEEPGVNFVPASDGVVDRHSDSIELSPGHGFVTGDLVFYDTDPNRSITIESELLGEIMLPDAPIRGLQTRTGYYVVVDSHDPDRIRLATSKAGALQAQVVDLVTGSGDASFLRADPAGISINASLDATNRVDAGVNLTSGKQPWTAVISGAVQGQVDSIGAAGYGFIDELRTKLNTNSIAPAKQSTETDADSDEGVDVASSIAVAYFDHKVHATVTKTAVLRSQGDIEVDAEIVQRARLSTVAESTRNALNEESDDREYASSIGVGVYKNEAIAIMASESTNASGQTAVRSNVSYPILVGNRGDGVNFASTVGAGGMSTVQALIDGTLGLSNLLNVQTRTLADGSKSPLSLAVGVVVTDYTNRSIARIESGASLNQESMGQSVLVDAGLDAFLLEAGQMASLNLSLPGLAEAIQRNQLRTESSFTDFLTDLVNPLGVSGKDAAGGTLLITSADNTTSATIGENARVDAWSEIDVIAESDFYNFAFVQTGTGSTRLGFSAAIANSNLLTSTTAAINDGAIIEAASLNVDALDRVDRVAYAGAILKGKQAGVGTSVAVNYVDQNVAAFIGRENGIDQEALTAPLDATIQVTDDVSVHAIAAGEVSALTISGALQGIGEAEPENGKGGATTRKANGGRSIGAIALTVPVAINTVSSDVQALVDHQNVTAESISVHAGDEDSDASLQVNAMVIGGSFALQLATNAKLNLAAAGAVVVNDVDLNTVAMIRDSEIKAIGDAQVKAVESASVKADAGGLAVSAGIGSKVALSFGVSVGINDVDSDVLARLDNSRIHNGSSTAGDVQAIALTGTTIQSDALAGAASLRSGATPGGSLGGAGAAARNWVEQDVIADVMNSDINAAALTVSAQNQSTVIANSTGFGIGVTSNPGIAAGVSLGIGLSFNEVRGQTFASVSDSALTISGDLEVNATDSTNLTAYADSVSGGAAVGAGVSVALAGAGSGTHNDMERAITAHIESSQVESANVGVKANDESSLSARTLGTTVGAVGAGGAGVTVPIGITIAKNENRNTVEAAVTNANDIATFINARESVLVKAFSDTDLVAEAVAASYAAGIAAGAGIAVSGAGTAAENWLSASTAARVSNSTVIAGGDATVDARRDATVRADILSQATSLAGGNIGGGAAIGISIATNKVVSLDPIDDAPEYRSEIQAFVRDSRIDAGSVFSVLSTSNDDVDAVVQSDAMAGALGNIGVAGAGAGGGAFNELRSDVSAFVDGERAVGGVRGITADRAIVSADDTSDVVARVDSLALTASAGAGGAAAISIAVSRAVTEIQNNVSASLSDTSLSELADGQSLSVVASENATSKADAHAGAVGLALSFASFSVSGGGAESHSVIASTTRAAVTSSDLNLPDSALEVLSTNTSISDAETHAWNGSLAILSLAAGGSVAVSNITPNATAEIVHSDVSAGQVDIIATANPTAFARASGWSVNIGIGAAVGVSSARVNLSGSVTALLDSDGKRFEAGTLRQRADLNQAVASKAMAQGSSGGLLLGVDASTAFVENTIDVLAEIADGSTLMVDDIDMFARRSSQHYAEASGLALGSVAVGSTRASTTDRGSDIARVGSNVVITGDQLSINAASIDRSFADSVAGGGGIGSAASATAKTTSDTETISSIGDAAELTLSGDFRMRANHLANFDTVLSATGIGFVSGAGGRLDNLASAVVRSEFGEGAVVSAGKVDATAINRIEKSTSSFLSQDRDNVNATVGAIVGGLGVTSQTVLDLTTEVLVNDSADVDATGEVNLHALNQVDARDSLTVRSGGLASGAGVRSSIASGLFPDLFPGLSDHTARITIAPNATVDTLAALTISARSVGNAHVQASTEVFGALSVEVGDATVQLRPINTLAIDGRLTAAGNIRLLAGTNLAGHADRHDITSRLDAFAASLIPIQDSTAMATLVTTNRIEIGSGAVTESGGDIVLDAEDSERNDPKATAKSVSWVSGAVDFVEGLFSEGGQEQTAGNAIESTLSEVIVDGTVRTGLDRVKRLEILSVQPDELADAGFALTLSDDSAGDISYQLQLSDVTSPLIAEIRRLRSLMVDHQHNQTLVDQYQNEIDRMEEQLAAQGLSETPTGASAPQRIEQTKLTVVLDPIQARAGSITITAGEFLGTGDLDAPGDAGIEIINHSGVFIETTGLFIPQRNGGVTINGDETPSSTAGPVILIENRALAQDLRVGVAPVLWPSITVSGPIESLGGNLTLMNPASGAGDIIINAPIEVFSQTITAGNQGTLTIDLSSGRATFEGATEHARIQPILDGITEQLPAGCITNLFVPCETRQWLRPAEYNAFIETGYPESRLYANRIFISAQYVNINSLIESGQQDYQLTLGDDVASAIAANTLNQRIDFDPNDHLGGSEDFGVWYDPESGRIVVEELRAGGGFVEINGHIANTHSGEIRVLGGYSHLEIDNQTEYPIEIRRLDVGDRGAGTIILNDQTKGPMPERCVTGLFGDICIPGTPLNSPELSQTTIYRQEGNVVVKDVEGTETIYEDLSDIAYQPADGLRYEWSIAENTGTRTDRVYQTSSWLGAIDAFAPDGENNTVNTTVRNYDAEVVDAGSYFTFDDSTANYLHSGRKLTTTSGEKVVDRWTDWSGFLNWNKDYYTRTVEESLTQRISTHSIEADRDIQIRFVGYQEGSVVIESAGDVFFAGRVVNPTGLTRVNSTESTGGTIQGDRFGIIGGRRVILNGHSELGSEADPLRIEQTNDAVFDHTSGDAVVYGGQTVMVAPEHQGGGVVGQRYRFRGTRLEIDSQTDFANGDLWQPDRFIPSLDIDAASANVREVTGDLFVYSVGTGSGSLKLEAPDSILPSYLPSGEETVFGSAVGTRVELIAGGGSIGTAESPLLIAAIDAFNGSARDDIFLEVRYTDLPVDAIQAGGLVSIETFGGSSVVDKRTSDDLDDRDAFELREVWQSLQLTSDDAISNDIGFENKRTARIETLENAKTLEYNAYWRLRNTQENPTLYDPTHSIELSPIERPFYDDPQVIATLETSRTTQYHVLQDEYGSLGDTFDPNFRYTATGDDLAQIDATMRKWTIDELQNTFNFVEVTDTEFVVEQPNIIASEIRLSAGLDSPGENASIGLQGEPHFVELPSEGGTRTISIEQQALLAAARQSDLLYLSTAPIDVTGSSRGYQDGNDATVVALRLTNDANGTWSERGVVAGQEVYLDLSNDFADRYYEGLYRVRRMEDSGRTLIFETFSESGTEVSYRDLGQGTLSPKIDREDATHIRVARREDIDVQTDGAIHAIASGDIYLGSMDDLTIGRVHSLRDDGVGSLRIKIDGNLLGEPNQVDVAHVRGQNLLLESAEGNVGTTGAPLLFDVTRNNTLTVRAEGAIVLQQEQSDPVPFLGREDLFIDQLFSATSLIDVTTEFGIADAWDSPQTNIKAAGDLFLRSGGGIGEMGDGISGFVVGENYLDIEVGGSVTAIADNGILLSENNGDLNVRQISTVTNPNASNGRPVHLRADGSIIDAVDVVDPMDPTAVDAPGIAGNPVADIVGSWIKLQSLGGTIGQAANELDINQIGTNSGGEGSVFILDYLMPRLEVASLLNTYVNETEGDLYLGGAQTGQTTFFAALTGGILTPMIGQEAIETEKLWLFARDRIGTQDNPIEMTAGSLEGASVTGGVYLQNTGDLTIGGVVDSPAIAEGEEAGAGASPTRAEGASGLAAGGNLSIYSSQSIAIAEELTANDILLSGAAAIHLPEGVSIRSAQLLRFVSQRSEILGTVDAAETVVAGTVGDDTVIAKPKSLSGLLRVETHEGDDRIVVEGGCFTIDAGSGNNEISRVELCNVIVSTSGPGETTHRIKTIADENISGLPVSTLRLHGVDAPEASISDPRFEYADGTLGLKSGEFLSTDEGESVEIQVILTDPQSRQHEVTHLIDIAIESNDLVWQNPGSIYDVNQSDSVSAIDALVVINELARRNSDRLGARPYRSTLPFYDVTGDGRLSALDALRVINHLARQASSSGEHVKTNTLPEGERETDALGWWMGGIEDNDDEDDESCYDLIARDLNGLS